jgi:hypothetical protein
MTPARSAAKAGTFEFDGRTICRSGLGTMRLRHTADRVVSNAVAASGVAIFPRYCSRETARARIYQTGALCWARGKYKPLYDGAALSRKKVGPVINGRAGQ